MYMLQYSALFLLIAARKKSNKRPFGMLSKLLPSETSLRCGISMDSIFFMWKWEYPSLKFCL